MVELTAALNWAAFSFYLSLGPLLRDAIIIFMFEDKTQK
jgi:hypothetical protein